MNARHRFIALSLLVSAPFLMPSSAQAASFSTLILTPLTIEGLTGDSRGNLYAPGRYAGRRSAVSGLAHQHCQSIAGLGGQHPSAERDHAMLAFGPCLRSAGQALREPRPTRSIASSPMTERRRPLTCSRPACRARTDWPSTPMEICGPETGRPALAACGRSAPPGSLPRCSACSQWRTTWSRAA